ncbi:MAG TPA: PhzF family phenazine biosynthesis protein [Pyrinomonadaceae bacterium]|nr:PhzF family phenazine biosynthesis protein [Pyrinomonadaceae bacterium]
MPNYRFLQLDVFTDKAFAGNPLAVFPDAEGISDELMLKIAREMNLSETVFVLKSDSEEVLRRLRIFTPTREIPFAGHPVVGTWNALAREGVVPLPDNGNGWQHILHEVGIGVLPVDIEFKNGQPVQVVMTQGPFAILDEIDDAHEQAEVARALGLAREDLDETLPIQVITTGLSCLAVPIRSLADLRDCRVNAALLAEIYIRRGATGCHTFTRETIEIGASRAHARFFAPADNIPEDPATGSACGALGAYLVHHGALTLEPENGRYKFIIEQGDFIHRPSRINLDVKGEAGNVEEVKVGGPAVVVAHGEIFATDERG